ncbi:MAG: hypothetical protein ACKOA9_12775 [Actinomycetota bacterium]
MTEGGGNRRRRSRSAARRKGSARPFWGDAETAAGPEHGIEPVDHPTALIDSLGTPPFPRADPAPHYFAAVYNRATGMALALAHAYGIVETGDPDDTPTETGPGGETG